MLDFLQRNLQPKSEPLGQLTIERRVLITPRTTVAISNIAAVSTGTVRVPRKLLWNLALAALAAGMISLVVGYDQKSHLGMAISAVGILAGLVLARFFATTELPCLSIASSGSHTLVFTGQRKTLEEARRLLSDKINSGDESSIYRIHFEKGMVQPVSHAESIASILPSPGHHPSIGNGRNGAFEPVLHTVGLPGPQLGNGHYANGNGHSHHVDYSLVLPQIVDMLRFYAQRQDTQEIAERLNELEYLMRSGTPTATSRSRLNHLVAELTSILGAYPSVVQIFQQSARLAGV